VIFVHGSGSSHLSPRNQQVARDLTATNFGTLLFDLLTPQEEDIQANVFNIKLLSERLNYVTQWLKMQPEYNDEAIVYFGASTGAAAALTAVALYKDESLKAIVSRGGRPDLAGENLQNVSPPVFLIVGEKDQMVLELNKKAQARLKNAELDVIAGATHLFPEPGALAQVSQDVIEWLTKIIKSEKKTTTSSSFVKNKEQQSLSP